MNYRHPAKGIRYAGSKGKCREIIKLIQSCIRPGDIFWEPFVGAGKVIQSIRGCERWGSDIDEPIITLLQAVQQGWNPPLKVSEKEYKEWMAQRNDAIHPMMGFVGYGCSFGGRYFQGYARSKKGTVNFAKSARSALLRQKPFLEGVNLWVGDYREDHHFKTRPQPNVIYCDAPYKGTKPVGSMPPFDHKAYYKWLKEQSKHSIVLVSEYHLPIPGAEIIWEKKVAAGIRFGTKGDGGNIGSGQVKVERLYCLKPSVRRNIGFGVL